MKLHITSVFLDAFANLMVMIIIFAHGSALVSANLSLTKWLLSFRCRSPGLMQK